MLELDSGAGMYIGTVCKNAVALANEKNTAVHFCFNDTHVVVQPNELAEDVQNRWDKDRTEAYEKWIASPEYAEREAQREAKDKRLLAAVFKEDAQTEEAMRDAKVPWPYTKQQLSDYIESLVNRDHNYGTCVYALSMAAEAAFNYVAHKLGVTGFQSSCADLDFIRRVRSMEGPFILLKAEDMVYPQYDLEEKLRKAMESWKPWVKEQAQKNLDKDSEHCHPDVVAHWKKLTEEK